MMKLKSILISAICFFSIFGFFSMVQADDNGIVLRVKSSAVYTDGTVPERHADAFYKNIQDAMSAAESGDTIQLTENLVQDASINDGWGVKVTLPDVTLDLNGYSFKDSKNYGSAFIIVENAGLTIKNSGSSETGSILSTAGKNCITIQKGGTLIVLSGVIKNSRNIGKTIENSGAMTMYGGTVTGSNIAILNQGTFGDARDYTLIYDGTVTSGKNHAVSVSSGMFCIYGGGIKCPENKSCIHVTDESSCSLRIRGGVFSEDVSGQCIEGEYTCCINDHEDTAAVYPWKVVSEKQVRIEAFCAAADGSGICGPSDDFGNVLGGGTYCVGDRIVLTAPFKSGWQFNGWYQKKNDTWISLSQEIPYTCILFPEENMLVAAGYVKTESASIVLHVEGSNYMISGTSGQDGCYDTDQDFNCSFGSEISLTSGNEDSFHYWLNDSGKIAARSRNYTFTVVRDTTVRESRLNEDVLKTGLQFFSAYHQLLRETKEDGQSEISFPSIQPAGAGQNFTGWIFSDTHENADEETVLNRVQAQSYGNIEILSEVESAGETCDITLVYEQIRDTETFADQTVGETISVTSDLQYVPEGKKFAYWADGDGRILCFSEIFRMYAVSDQFLSVRCIGEKEETTVIPALNWQDITAAENGDTISFSLSTIRTVPDDFQIVDHGILYTACDGESLTLTDSQAEKIISSDLSRNGIFTGELCGNCETYGETGLYCRGFLVLRKDDAFYILYTDIQHAV